MPMQAVCLSLKEQILTNRISKFTYDFENATLIRILQAYQNERRIVKPRYNCMDEVISVIRRFEDYVDVELYPCDISSLLLSELQSYMMNVRKNKPSTVSNIFGRLKAALTWSIPYGAKVHPTYKNYEIPKYRTPQYSPTADDISNIYHLRLDLMQMRKQHRRNLEKVKDMYVFSFMLGQRYSDMKRITKSMWRDNGSKLVICQQKTGKNVVVDTAIVSYDTNILHEIQEKYDYCAPYNRDLSCYNKYLKQLFQLVGGSFDDTITYQVKVGSDIVEESAAKWRCIGKSHCSRRGFVTYNLNVNKLTDTQVMHATGHSTSEILHVYDTYGC